jgi:hypothetical protein
MDAGDKTITKTDNRRLYRNNQLIIPNEKEYKDLIVVMSEGLIAQQRKAIVEIYHDRKIAGHPGIEKTLELI